MDTYTSVVFGVEELSILKRASLHLAVAFPDMHQPMPKNRGERIEDHRARIVLNLTRDSTQGTHENVAQALAVMTRLCEVLTEQAQLDYWLDLHQRDTGTRPEPSGEPTSGYQQYRTAADIKAGQLVDARRAQAVLRYAASKTTPRQAAHDIDYDELVTA